MHTWGIALIGGGAGLLLWLVWMGVCEYLCRACVAIISSLTDEDEE